MPKVIDTSQADIDAAITAIKASEIEGGTKDFAIDDVNNNDVTIQSNVESIETPPSTASNEIAKSKPGHGRLPHSAYINITEHQLSHAEYKTGDLCPCIVVEKNIVHSEIPSLQGGGNIKYLTLHHQRH